MIKILSAKKFQMKLKATIQASGRLGFMDEAAKALHLDAGVPMNFPMRTNTKYYEAKVKRFITDVALGMLPGQPWEASHQAAGILVVTKRVR